MANGQAQAVYDTWAEVLEVPREDLLPHLGRAASLIGEIERAIIEGGHQDQMDVYQQFKRHWSTPFTGGDHNPNAGQNPGKALVDDGALAALRSLAGFLSMARPEGSVPSEEVTASFREQLNSLLEELAVDDETPKELRVIISHRLHDVLWALDHVRIGGPDAVAAAVERLLGQVVIYASNPEQRAGVVQRVMAAASTVWKAYKIGPEVAHALEGWESVIQSLPPGS